MYRNTRAPGRVVLEGKELHRVEIKIEPTNDYAQVWVSAKILKNSVVYLISQKMTLIDSDC